MPTYEYQCTYCNKVQEVFSSIKDMKVCLDCKDCNSINSARRVILSTPNTVIPPNMRATSSKLKYYGVTNPITGEGVTANTDVRDPSGIRVSSKGL